jgi:cell division protein FtsB
LAKTKKKKKINNRSIIAIVLGSFILLYLVVSIVKTQIDINKKEADLAALQSTYESQIAENEALESAVAKGDEAELAEEYARKKGYVMPDERVYVDITPGV